MDNIISAATIDWEWVRSHLSARERIEKIGTGSTKGSVLEHLKEALQIARVKAAPRIYSVKKEILNFKPGSFQIEGDMIFSGKELSKHIKGATHICAFLVTVGKEIEEAASSYMHLGDHLLGYLLDRAGSFAVESMAKNTEDSLRRALLTEGLSVSMRFSPGYCDWPIEEQFKLAQIIDFGKAGVRLSENCMMIPKKSISAVAGVGPKELFSEIKSPCSHCNMKVCGHRRNS